MGMPLRLSARPLPTAPTILDFSITTNDLSHLAGEWSKGECSITEKLHKITLEMALANQPIDREHLLCILTNTVLLACDISAELGLDLESAMYEACLSRNDVCEIRDSCNNVSTSPQVTPSFEGDTWEPKRLLDATCFSKN